MSIPTHKIGFDFDGVIADTAEAFIRLACKNYNYCTFSQEDITNFELENCIGIPRDNIEAIFNDILLDSLTTGLQPMEGAVETLCQITEESQVTIITARPIHQPVFDWLDHFFPAPAVEKICIVATGDHNDKVRHIQQHGIEYFVDDRAETCMQLASEGITPFVFSQPWNQGRHNLQTVANWKEVNELLF